MDLTAEERQLIADRRKAAQATAFEHVDENDTALEVPTPKPAPSAAAVEPKPHNHPAFLVRMAKQYGFSDTDIQNTSPEILERQVEAINDREMKRSQSTLADLDRLARIQPKPPPEPTVTKPEDDVDLSDILGDVAADDIDVRFLNVLKRQEKKRQKELADLKTQVERGTATAQQTETQRRNGLLDQLFAASGRENVFGKGPMGPNIGPQAAARRLAVVQFIDTNNGGKVDEQAFQMAVETLYGKKKATAGTPAGAGEGVEDDPYAPKPQPARKPSRQTAPTEDDYEEGQVSRPTNRRGAAEMKGEAKARRAVKEKMDEQGITFRDDDDDADIDGFLG